MFVFVYFFVDKFSDTRIMELFSRGLRIKSEIKRSLFYIDDCLHERELFSVSANIKRCEESIQQLRSIIFDLNRLGSRGSIKASQLRAGLSSLSIRLNKYRSDYLKLLKS